VVVFGGDTRQKHPDCQDEKRIFVYYHT